MTAVILKLKGDSSSSQTYTAEENAIYINGQTYKFQAVIKNSFPEKSLQSLGRASNLLILAGTSESGKTASLHEILQYFAGLGDLVHVTACDISKNGSFVDFFDESASRRFLGSTPIDNQLKRITLDPRRASKLMKDIAAASTTSPVSHNRSCVLVNLYRDSKMFTVVDMAGVEKFKAKTSGTSLAHYLLAGPAGRSHKLVTSLILRRASSSQLNFVVHLEGNGNQDAMKSSLENISQAMKSDSVYVKPERANAAGALPHSLKGVPNYAKPTVSSGSPLKTLSSFRVDKPVAKKRVAGTSQTGVKRQMGSLRQVNSRNRNPSSSPATREEESLQKEADSLRLQLSQNKISHVEVLRTLKAEVRALKEESFRASAEISRSRFGFQELVGENEDHKKSTLLLKQELAAISAEKAGLESELTQLSRSVAEKTEEIRRVQEVSSDEKRGMAVAFETELRQNKKERSSLEKEISSLVESKNSAERSLAEKMEEIGQIKEVTSNEKRELASTFEAELKQNKKAVMSLESEIASLVESKNQLEQSLVERASEIKQIKEISSDEKRELTVTSEAELEQSRKAVASLESEITTLINSKNHLESSLVEKDEEIARMAGVSSNEKRELAVNFEAELKQNKKAVAFLEKEISTLVEAKNQSELQATLLLEQKSRLQTEVTLIGDKLIQVSEENNILKTKMKEVEAMASAREDSLRASERHLLDQSEKIRVLEEQKQEVLAVSNSTMETQNSINEQNVETISQLKEQLETEMKKSAERERDLHNSLRSQSEKSAAVIDGLEARVLEITSKVNQQRRTIDAGEKDIAILRKHSDEQSVSLKEAQEYKIKCKRLEIAIDELAEKTRQKDAEHEKHVIQLNEELGKARGSAISPKKLHEYPDLDFNHANNTFSSIDIFEDQTEYMNFFRRPAAGRSPVPSPTRVLTESNVRVSASPKLTGKASSNKSTESAHLIEQEIIDHN